MGETRKKVAPKHLIALAWIQPAVLQSRPKLARELQPARRVIERIAPEIATIDLGVHAFGRSTEAGVDVVAKGQLRLPASTGNFRQLFFFLRGCDRLVRIFDRPVIIGADRVHHIIALRLVLQGEVDGVIVHHRSADAVGGGERRVR